MDFDSSTLKSRTYNMLRIVISSLECVKNKKIESLQFIASVFCRLSPPLGGSLSFPLPCWVVSSLFYARNFCVRRKLLTKKPLSCLRRSCPRRTSLKLRMLRSVDPEIWKLWTKKSCGTLGKSTLYVGETVWLNLRISSFFVWIYLLIIVTLSCFIVVLSLSMLIILCVYHIVCLSCTMDLLCIGMWDLRPSNWFLRIETMRTDRNCEKATLFLVDSVNSQTKNLDSVSPTGIWTASLFGRHRESVWYW